MDSGDHERWRFSDVHGCPAPWFRSSEHVNVRVKWEYTALQLACTRMFASRFPFYLIWGDMHSCAIEILRFDQVPGKPPVQLPMHETGIQRSLHGTSWICRETSRSPLVDRRSSCHCLATASMSAVAQHRKGTGLREDWGRRKSEVSIWHNLTHAKGSIDPL